MLMVVVMTLNRNQSQAIFDSLIGQLIRSSVISSENVIIRGMKIWVITTYAVVDYFTVSNAMFITLSHFFV